MEPTDPVAAPPHESREELLAKARALIGERRIPAAMAILQELVDFDLHDVDAWGLLAHAWHRWGHGDKCQRSAEFGLRVDSQSPLGHVWKSRGLLIQDQKKAALEAAREGMTATQGNPDCRRVLVETLIANERLPEAEANLRTLRTEFPDDPDLVVRQGEIHFGKKEFAAAETAFHGVLTTASEPAEAWAWLGAARLHQERRREAVPCYYRAALAAPTGSGYPKLLVELLDAQLERRMHIACGVYTVAALIGAAMAYSVHPLLAFVTVLLMIWGWRFARRALVNDSLRPWAKEVGDYYRTQKPVVDRQNVTSLGIGWFVVLMILGPLVGASEISRLGLWPDVGRLFLVVVLPVFLFGVLKDERPQELPGETACFWFPDEETEAVKFSGDASQTADPVENARALLRGQRLNAARRTATRVLATEPANLGAHTAYSLALLAAGDAEGGLAAARRLQSLAPDDPAARALVWLQQAAAGPADTVLAEMRRHAGDGDAERQAFAGYVRDLGAAGAAEAAGAACVVLSQWMPESAESIGLQADRLSTQGRVDEAEAAYRRAHERAPESPIYLTSLGWMALRRRRLREARNLWCEALRQDASYAPAATSLGSLVNWAVLLGAMGTAAAAAIVTAVPTLLGRPQNDRMLWVTLAAPFLAAASVKPVQRLAAMLILPPLSPTQSRLTQSDTTSTPWIAGILGLEATLVIHTVQAWIEIALHPGLWEVRWKGAATVTLVATYLVILLIWRRRKSHRADRVVRDRMLAEGIDP